MKESLHVLGRGRDGWTGVGRVCIGGTFWATWASPYLSRFTLTRFILPLQLLFTCILSSLLWSPLPYSFPLHPHFILSPSVLIPLLATFHPYTHIHLLFHHHQSVLIFISPCAFIFSFSLIPTHQHLIFFFPPATPSDICIILFIPHALTLAPSPVSLSLPTHTLIHSFYPRRIQTDVMCCIYLLMNLNLCLLLPLK